MPDWMGGTDIAFPNLGIYLENVPKFFTVFGFEIAIYGVCIGLGIIGAFWLAAWQAKKVGQDPEDYFDVGLYLVIFGILGARIYYVIFMWDYYKAHPASIFNLREGGIAMYGSIIGGFLAMLVWSKVKKKKLFPMTDVAIQGVLVGQIIGRWGNFFNREVFGEYSDGLFAMRLPVEAVRESDISETIRANMVPGTNYIQVHPTFLYEGFFNFILLVLLVCFHKKKKFDGEVLLWYMGGYGIIRFIIEGIRTDQLKIPGTGLPVSQVLSAMLLAVAVVIDLYVRIKMKRKPAASSDIKEKDKTEA